MSEVQTRSQAPATRGRGGGRGGRGGFGGRSEGRPSNRRVNGDKTATADSASAPTIDDDGDVGQLRQQYGDKLDLIKELFQDWSDADLLYALQETDGDLEVAATRIADGTISQWGEVSKQKKDRTKPKPKEAANTSATDSSAATRPARGGRTEGGRGGRGRASERARGSGRGRAASHAATNGTRTKENQQLSVPTEESSGWGNTDETTADWGTNDATTTDSATPSKPAAAASTKTETPAQSAPAPPAQKTWASMLRQSTAPKPAPKPKEAPVPKPAEVIEPLPAAEAEAEAPTEEADDETAEIPTTTEPAKIIEPEVALPPPEDDLTKKNLEQLPDESKPVGTATVASTAADSWDPRQPQQSATATPLSASQAQHQAARSNASGYAATALKATERPVRVPSYQRRLLEQEEAVRMPGNREVDRAAVQFGAFSLNGEEDIDGDREDPETRAQPPAESPVAMPRASLPPVVQPAAVPESLPAAQKPAATAAAAATPVAPPTGPASSIAQPPAAPSANQQYGRFGQNNAQDQTQYSQKPYDSFGQPTATTSSGSLDSFPAATTQAPSQPAGGAFSSAPGDYSSAFSDQQGRNYNNYYGQQYGQYGSQAQQDAPSSQQRPFGTYGATQSDNLSQYPQSRYGAGASSDVQNSGNNTPNPPAAAAAAGQGQQPSAQGSQPQSGLHQQPHGNYPYQQQHPYYNSPYYANYMQQQYGGAYSQGGFGGGPYGKGGMYGQPHQYGMSPQAPYDHSSSPATSGFGGQSSLHGGRDSGLGSSVDNYGRTGSAQSGAQPALGNSGFGGVHDSFGRGGSAYGGQGQPFGNTGSQSTNAGASTDDLKPYGDAKSTSGPSPSLAAAARPGSAANNTTSGSGLPPPQSNQPGMSGYGGYPSHLQGHGNLHGNQSGASGYGLGGSAGQAHGNTPYAGYGGNQGFGGYYGRQGGGGGWGGNYGNH